MLDRLTKAKSNHRRAALCATLTRARITVAVFACQSVARRARRGVLSLLAKALSCARIQATHTDGRHFDGASAMIEGFSSRWTPFQWRVGQRDPRFVQRFV